MVSKPEEFRLGGIFSVFTRKSIFFGASPPVRGLPEEIFALLKGIINFGIQVLKLIGNKISDFLQVKDRPILADV